VINQVNSAWPWVGASERKLGRKQVHRAMHVPCICVLQCKLIYGWGLTNGAHRRLIGFMAVEGLYVYYARQLYRQVLLRARISYGNSVRPSVCLSVTTRYRFKAK